MGALCATVLSRPSLAAAEKTVVDFDTPERPGTLIVNTAEKALYRVLGEGLAMHYPVAVGREGHDWAGIAVVGRKVEWPNWTPPADMLRRTIASSPGS